MPVKLWQWGGGQGRSRFNSSALHKRQQLVRDLGEDVFGQTSHAEDLVSRSVDVVSEWDKLDEQMEKVNSDFIIDCVQVLCVSVQFTNKHVSGCIHLGLSMSFKDKIIIIKSPLNTQCLARQKRNQQQKKNNQYREHQGIKAKVTNICLPPLVVRVITQTYDIYDVSSFLSGASQTWIFPCLCSLQRFHDYGCSPFQLCPWCTRMGISHTRTHTCTHTHFKIWS